MGHSRRDVLKAIVPTKDTNAGLWLDKYLIAQADDTSKKSLVYEIAAIMQPGDLYGAFFNRWKQSLEKAGARVRIARMKPTSRLAINLGAENVIETSIALHGTYGVPYIPGSALKGLAAAYARNQLKDDSWRKNDGEAYKILFGNANNAGYVTFFDALYIPRNVKKDQALWPDVIVPHHPDFNQGQADAPPADWDNPTPINFLTAAGEFLVALSGPDEWVEAAFKILGLALEKEGIGAKTSSGYGRMSLFSWMHDEPMNEMETAAPKNAPPPGYRSGTVRDFGLGKKQSYGFITPDGGGADLFVHVNNLSGGMDNLNPGQRVIFKIVQGSQGPQAQDVMLE